MLLMVLKLLLAYAAISVSVSALADSEGTDFIFSFVRNADADAAVPNQQLSITVLNGANLQSCNLTLTYKPEYEAPSQNKTVTVPPQSALDVPIPSFYGNPFITTSSVQNSYILHETLFATSTCPVSILANNYDTKTGKGETFTVPPKTFGGFSFTFTLPPVLMDKQFQQVSFLPTQGSANVVLTIPQIGSLSDFSVNDINGTSYIALKSLSKTQSITYHVTSDAPILIVAGVTCNGVNMDTCDHICFMPQSLPDADCYPNGSLLDAHLSEFLDNQFYPDISGDCDDVQSVILSDGTVTEPFFVSPKDQTVPIVNDGRKGSVMYLQSTSAALHVSKYYDGNNDDGRGSYILSVPSTHQMISSDSYFFTRDPNSVITITCNLQTCSSIYMDDTLLLANFNYTHHGRLTVDNDSFWIVSQTVVDQGFHRLYFKTNLNVPKKYAYYIKSNDYRYGYTGLVNSPYVNVSIPPTTTPAYTTGQPSSSSMPMSSTAQPGSPSMPMSSTAPPASSRMPMSSTAQPGSPSMPMSSTAQPGSSSMPMSSTAQPGSSSKPMSSTAQPGSSSKPMSSTAQPGSSSKPMSSTAQPGSSSKPMSSTAQPGSSSKPMSSTAQPGSSSMPKSSTVQAMSSSMGSTTQQVPSTAVVTTPTNILTTTTKMSSSLSKLAVIVFLVTLL